MLTTAFQQIVALSAPAAREISRFSQSMFLAAGADGFQFLREKKAVAFVRSGIIRQEYSFQHELVCGGFLLPGMLLYAHSSVTGRHLAKTRLQVLEDSTVDFINGAHINRISARYKELRLIREQLFHLHVNQNAQAVYILSHPEPRARCRALLQLHPALQNLPAAQASEFLGVSACQWSHCLREHQPHLTTP